MIEVSIHCQNNITLVHAGKEVRFYCLRLWFQPNKTLARTLNVHVFGNRMDTTRRADGNLSSNNSEIGDEFDAYTDDKVCIYETIISGGYIKREPPDTEDTPGGIYNHVHIKDEVIDDPTVVSQETKLTTNAKDSKMQDKFDNCTGDTVCANDTVISKGYIKQEQCDTEDQLEHIHNHFDIKDEIIENPVLVSQKTELTTNAKDSKMQDKFDNCTGDTVCANDTVISKGYIKQEQCDTEDQLEHIHNHLDIKDEIIEDPVLVSQETKLTTITRGNPLAYCDECDEEYDLYCLKCSMLIRIFDSNMPNKTNNNVRLTLPSNLIDICETSAGVGIVALRAIPKGVVFGPFDGLNLAKDGVVSKWKLKDKKIVCTRDPSEINWMQYIRTADQSSNRNLTPFQCDDRLYYLTDRHISVGDELFVCWDRDTENTFCRPRVCKRLVDTYACTLCCVGYKSISHLTEHNSRCPEKQNGTYYSEEIIQCAFCKIYLDKKEYLDYHIDRCCYRNTNFRRKRHLVAHEGRKIFACTLCPYKANFSGNLKRHIAIHNDDKQFKCDICGKLFKQKVCLARHIRDLHSKVCDRKYKCPQCPFETSYKHSLKHHVNGHNKSELLQCPKCNFSTHNRSGLMSHLKCHEKAWLPSERMINVK